MEQRELNTPDLKAAQVERLKVSSLLHTCLKKLLTNQAIGWLDTKGAQAQASGIDRSFFLAFGTVSRKVEKAQLQLSEQDIADAMQLRTGWQPQYWDTRLAARVWLLLQVSGDSKQAYVRGIKEIFNTADAEEHRALFAALPLLDHPEAFVELASEGVRSNIIPVLESIMLYNPFAADFLDENAWNQLYLKAAFTDRPLYKIYGVERRANAVLARMISDYAHERWAASRIVSPEIWRPVSAFVDSAIWADLERLANDPDKLNQVVVALVCQKNDSPEAQTFLDKHLNSQTRFAEGWTWEKLGETWQKSKENA